MKHINTINNCKSLYFLANKTIYTIEDEFQTSTFIDNVSFNRYLSILNLSTYNNELYYFNDSELYKIVMNKLVEIAKFENVNGVEIVSENTIFSWQKLSRKEYLYTIRDFDNQILWSFQGSDSLKHINGIIFKIELFDDTKFEILDLKTGFPLWSYSLPEGFKIEGQIHLYDNILVVNQIDEQSCSIIVGLDILTGKKLWENKVSLIHYQQKNDFLYGFASNTFGDNVFSKINIKTGEVFEKSFENFAKQVASHLATIHNDNLYFSAYKIGEIGIIDLQKQEITQEFSLNLEKGVGIGAPVVTEDKIYILDSLNTLHIFEK